MISNYYILHSVVREIRERFIGARFLRAYSIHAGELRMEFDRGEIVAVLQPAHTTLYISGLNSHEPKRNVMSFFEELKGLELKNVAIEPYDKLVSLDFGEYKLQLRFFDSPNAVLTINGEFATAFKKEKAAKTTSSDSNSALPLFGKWLRTESAKEKLSEESFDENLRNSHQAYIYRRKDDLLLSPIILSSFSDYEKYGSASEAIERVIRYRVKSSALKNRRTSLLHKLHGALVRTQKAISDAESGVENSDRENKYLEYGNLIQTHALEIEKGTASFQNISLDPALNAYDNAKRYYDKARRARENRKELQTKLTTLIKEREKLKSFSERAEAASDLKEIDFLEKEISKSGFTLHQTSEDLTESDPLSRFRNFTVAGGFRVLVGKNAKQNDELTMKVAKKEDLWFHARHVPGSHVVLQTHNTKQIPKEAIEQAAEIAAYFSDAKTQKHAPVAYTKRKFVRKPKGAALGAVLLEREEVVIVTPKISGADS